MGLCIDVGHTVRNGDDPVEMINLCGERLYDFHMKDVTKAAKEGVATELGKGVIDIVGVLRTLLKAKYNYNVALEYEVNTTPEKRIQGMMECYAYLRGVLAAI